MQDTPAVARVRAVLRQLQRYAQTGEAIPEQTLLQMQRALSSGVLRWSRDFSTETALAELSSLSFSPTEPRVLAGDGYTRLLIELERGDTLARLSGVPVFDATGRIRTSESVRDGRTGAALDAGVVPSPEFFEENQNLDVYGVDSCEPYREESGPWIAPVPAWCHDRALLARHGRCADGATETHWSVGANAWSFRDVQSTDPCVLNVSQTRSHRVLFQVATLALAFERQVPAPTPDAGGRVQTREELALRSVRAEADERSPYRYGTQDSWAPIRSVPLPRLAANEEGTIVPWDLRRVVVAIAPREGSSGSRSVRVLDAENGRELVRVEGLLGMQSKSLGLVVVRNENTLTAIDVREGRALPSFVLAGAPRTTVFDPTGRFLGVGYGTGDGLRRVESWDLRQGRRVAGTEIPFEVFPLPDFLALGPDGSTVLLSDRSHLHLLTMDALPSLLPVQRARVALARFAARGTRAVAVQGEDRNLVELSLDRMVPEQAILGLNTDFDGHFARMRRNTNLLFSLERFSLVPASGATLVAMHEGLQRGVFHTEANTVLLALNDDRVLASFPKMNFTEALFDARERVLFLLRGVSDQAPWTLTRLDAVTGRTISETQGRGHFNPEMFSTSRQPAEAVQRVLSGAVRTRASPEVDFRSSSDGTRILVLSGPGINGVLQYNGWDDERSWPAVVGRRRVELWDASTGNRIAVLSEAQVSRERFVYNRENPVYRFVRALFEQSPTSLVRFFAHVFGNSHAVLLVGDHVEAFSLATGAQVAVKNAFPMAYVRQDFTAYGEQPEAPLFLSMDGEVSTFDGTTGTFRTLVRLPSVDGLVWAGVWRDGVGAVLLRNGMSYWWNKNTPNTHQAIRWSPGVDRGIDVVTDVVQHEEGTNYAVLRTQRNTARVVDVHNGRVLALANDPAGWGLNLSVAPDGSQAFVSTREQSVLVPLSPAKMRERACASVRAMPAWSALLEECAH